MASKSETENPAIPSPTPKATRPRTNRDWWPEQLDLQVLRQHSPRSNPMGTGKGGDTITSGLEGAWTPTPIQWDNSFFETLFGYEWELTKSPAGNQQWKPKGGAGAGTVPDAHDASKRHAPMMATTDLALRVDRFDLAGAKAKRS